MLYRVICCVGHVSVSMRPHHQLVHVVLIRLYLYICSWTDLQHLDEEEGYGPPDAY